VGFRVILARQAAERRDPPLPELMDLIVSVPWAEWCLETIALGIASKMSFDSLNPHLPT